MFAPIKFTALAASTLSLAFAAPAFADSAPAKAPQARVHHADLDLTSAKDVERLKMRIRRASGGVCAQYQGTSFFKCQDQTIANTEPMIAKAIARAETRARYADAGTSGARVQVGN
ncbi:UrcA family protein [Sphingobium aquiterrae]|uniref:UrcA family protein n=1 Tax=Sphingobium aquiterrae TaxID=2038656 RepID=UPI00301A6FC4